MFDRKFRKSDRRRERGATLVSVSLLSVALVSASLLLVRQANRSATESGVVVARERALMAAQASAELATAYYRELAEADTTYMSQALTGSYPASDPTKCVDIARDCIPGGFGTSKTAGVPATGMRAHDLTGRSDCAGRVCMRPGALTVLPNNSGTAIIPWREVPMNTILTNGDPEARVTVWVRNNAAEALGDSNPAGGGGTAHGTGSWILDEDQRFVVTAMAEVHGVQVTVEQEVAFDSPDAQQVWQMASPDLGYGGGHNNDNVAVETCEQGAYNTTVP